MSHVPWESRQVIGHKLKYDLLDTLSNTGSSCTALYWCMHIVSCGESCNIEFGIMLLLFSMVVAE